VGVKQQPNQTNHHTHTHRHTHTQTHIRARTLLVWEKLHYVRIVLGPRSLWESELAPPSYLVGRSLKTYLNTCIQNVYVVLCWVVAQLAHYHLRSRVYFYASRLLSDLMVSPSHQDSGFYVRHRVTWTALAAPRDPVINFIPLHPVTLSQTSYSRYFRSLLCTDERCREVFNNVVSIILIAHSTAFMIDLDCLCFTPQTLSEVYAEAAFHSVFSCRRSRINQLWRKLMWTKIKGS
jgi:hypothetical protein